MEAAEVIWAFEKDDCVVAVMSATYKGYQWILSDHGSARPRSAGIVIDTGFEETQVQAIKRARASLHFHISPLNKSDG